MSQSIRPGKPHGTRSWTGAGVSTRPGRRADPSRTGHGRDRCGIRRMSVAWFPSARRDRREARKYYDSKQPGLGRSLERTQPSWFDVACNTVFTGRWRRSEITRRHASTPPVALRQVSAPICQSQPDSCVRALRVGRPFQGQAACDPRLVQGSRARASEQWPAHDPAREDAHRLPGAHVLCATNPEEKLDRWAFRAGAARPESDGPQDREHVAAQSRASLSSDRAGGSRRDVCGLRGRGVSRGPTGTSAT